MNELKFVSLLRVKVGDGHEIGQEIVISLYLSARSQVMHTCRESDVSRLF